MNDDEGFTNFATELLLAAEPLDGEVRIIAITEAEREYLLRIVGEAESGPAATARLKLRAAAPVQELGTQRAPKGFRGWLESVFHRDGREAGNCRWCKRRARIDQYRLCAQCTPPNREQKPPARVPSIMFGQR